MQRLVKRNKRITPSRRQSVLRSSPLQDENTARAIRKVKKTSDGPSIALHDKLGALNSLAKIFAMAGRIEQPGMFDLIIAEKEHGF